jgi:hypothetical protein
VWLLGLQTGTTPLQAAINKGHQVVVTLLQNHELARQAAAWKQLTLQQPAVMPRKPSPFFAKKLFPEK